MTAIAHDQKDLPFALDRPLVAGEVTPASGTSKAGEREARNFNETLERRVEERTAQLEEVNEQLEAFAYTMSHDLRAPLRSMQGFAQALLEDYGDKLDATGKDYADRIVRAARRMDGLIEDLLEYSRLQRESLPVRLVDVRAVVRDAVGGAGGEAAKVGAEVVVEPAECHVVANAPVLTQVVSNLIGNAIKFVKLGVAPKIRVWCEEVDSFVRINVQDNGIGIAPEHRDRIFKVFERLHGSEKYPGTGIGLAIVRKGVERMGGRCGVESSLGQGSTFWIELPQGKI